MKVQTKPEESLFKNISEDEFRDLVEKNGLIGAINGIHQRNNKGKYSFSIDKTNPMNIYDEEKDTVGYPIIYHNTHQITPIEIGIAQDIRGIASQEHIVLSLPRDEETPSTGTIQFSHFLRRTTIPFSQDYSNEEVIERIKKIGKPYI